MVVEVQRAVAVCVWHTGDVPKDQHEAEFLVGHVPGGNDELFAFGTRVGIQPMSEHDQAQLWSDIAVLLILLETGAQRDEEQRKPGQSDLEEHFQVQDPPPWVQRRTHEEVVQVVAGHSVVVTGDKQSPQVQNNREDETGEDPTCHDLAKHVDDSVELEDTSDVQSDYQSCRNVQGPHSVTIIW